jgi:hypothetical protein
MTLGSDREQVESAEAYEPPALLHYGTIEEWTRGSVREGISISLVV